MPCTCSVLMADPASAGTASLKPCEPISRITAHINVLRRPAAKRQSSRYRKPMPSGGLAEDEVEEEEAVLSVMKEALVDGPILTDHAWLLCPAGLARRDF